MKRYSGQLKDIRSGAGKHQNNIARLKGKNPQDCFISFADFLFRFMLYSTFMTLYIDDSTSQFGAKKRFIVQ
jgi:hypothetical protein